MSSAVKFHFAALLTQDTLLRIIMRTVTFPFTHCKFGIARRDITPPVGIYARSWGAAVHDAAVGVHRPCLAMAAVFAPLTATEPMLALVGIDLGWFQYLQDEREKAPTRDAAHGHRRSAPADKPVAHARQCEREFAIEGCRGRRIDPALSRISGGSNCRGDSRRAAQSRAHLDHIRLWTLRAGAKSRLLG